MVKRSNQDAREIAELAAHFRGLWKEGQILQSWLRTHAAELRAYVREKNWCWHTVGLALTEAGITYRTGAGWSGENLRRSLDKALRLTKRERKRLRDAAQSAKPEPEPPPPRAPLGGLVCLSGGIAARTPAEAEFQIIRPKDDSPYKAPNDVVPLAPRRARTPLSEAEIDAIVAGRSARR